MQPTDQILSRLAESLSSPISEADLSALLPRLVTLAEQVQLLRSSPLLAEEPSLPPSLEESP